MSHRAFTLLRYVLLFITNVNIPIEIMQQNIIENCNERERERKSGQHSTEQTRQTETPHREGVEIVQKKTVWSQRMELTICGGNPCSGK